MKLAPALAAAIALALGGCQSGATGAGRLAPRAAEQIDPRAPIPDVEPGGPANPLLLAELARIRARGMAATGPFDALAGPARAAAAAAGPRQSESWIAAQEALSALVAAGAPLASALGDLDALGAARIGQLTAPDRKAIAATTADLSALEQRQAAVTAAISARLSR